MPRNPVRWGLGPAGSGELPGPGRKPLGRAAWFRARGRCPARVGAEGPCRRVGGAPPRPPALAGNRPPPPALASRFLLQVCEAREGISNSGRRARSPFRGALRGRAVVAVTAPGRCRPLRFLLVSLRSRWAPGSRHCRQSF